MGEIFKNGLALMVGGFASLSTAIFFVIRWLGGQ